MDVKVAEQAEIFLAFIITILQLAFIAWISLELLLYLYIINILLQF